MGSRCSRRPTTCGSSLMGRTARRGGPPCRCSRTARYASAFGPALTAHCPQGCVGRVVGALCG
eukprot:4451400-Prymnesium_polylepis.2